ncbi:hypothetical protein LR48_Vigan07g170900 [Vigna angularis]|uniref:Uncharacterized protein n=1 Tax=Phaseolus angularis TaxID=3914 RepID=A0A0L9UYT6_PHAAN|nr:hypothetical protein LR48_Vigan07g170900 [Vigna angularis]
MLASFNSFFSMMYDLHEYQKDKIKKSVLGAQVHQEKKVEEDIKENGVIEIEAPYSRRVKMVNRKMLQMSWCDESRRKTNNIDADCA